MTAMPVRRAITSGFRLAPLPPITTPRAMQSSGTLATERVGVILSFPPRDADDQAIRDYVSQLWAEDWDSPEDEIYDSW
jgi:hypothetical protein